MQTRPVISIIVAIGRDGAIGRRNSLIWHLPGDLPRFKSLTMGKTVIMGRNTWLSLPNRPLPGRRNIILSKNNDFIAEGAQKAGSLEEALMSCSSEDEIMIIGGGKVYAEALAIADRLYLTQVDTDTPDADTFLDLKGLKGFRLIHSEQGNAKEGTPRFKFADYVRTKE